MLYKLKLHGTFTYNQTGQKFVLAPGAIFVLLHRKDLSERFAIMMAPFGGVYSLNFPDEQFSECFDVHE